MAQSRKSSLAEVTASTGVGYGVALGTQMIIFPLYGLPSQLSANMQIAALFTIVSIIRSYCFRRLWNRFEGGNHAAA